MNTLSHRVRVLALGAALTLAAANLGASDVAHMTLRDLVGRADRIVRGTVLESTEGKIQAGGGSLPIVTYRIQVDQALKGAAGAGDIIEVRLLGVPKQAASGAFRRATMLKDLPQFRVRGNYLFVLTRPSAIGLSTTVGLGQGLFQVQGRPGAETAVNSANNLGLFIGVSDAPQAAGPVAYSTLVQQIKNLLSR
jgi:hypothetical protein